MGFCRTRGDAQSSPLPLREVGLCRDPEPRGQWLRSEFGPPSPILYILREKMDRNPDFFTRNLPILKGLQRFHYFKAGSPLQTPGRADLHQVNALPHAKMSPPCCQWGCAWGPLPPDKHKASPSSLTCPGLPPGISAGVTLVSLFHSFSIVSERLPWALSNTSHNLSWVMRCSPNQGTCVYGSHPSPMSLVLETRAVVFVVRILLGWELR